MPRPAVLTDTFIAKCDKELVKEGQTLHTVARTMKKSVSTIYRATGGRKAALLRAKGETVARPYEVQRAAEQRKDRTRASVRKAGAKHRKAVAKAKPRAKSRRRAA